jgi:hypothetical protein
LRKCGPRGVTTDRVPDVRMLRAGFTGLAQNELDWTQPFPPFRIIGNASGWAGRPGHLL